MLVYTTNGEWVNCKNKIFTDLYEFIESVSHTGQAICYLSKNKTTGEVVFVKETKNSHFFNNEIKMYTKIGYHEFIPKFYAAYTVYGTFYIVMEYIKSGILGSRLNLSVIWKFLETIVDVLIHLQNLEILHCDIKPDNILQTETGDFRLIDFGISFCECAYTVRDTPLYMAPEFIKLRNEFYPNISFKDLSKIDIWSLGVVLYEMVKISHPYNPKSVKRLTEDCINGTLKVESVNLTKNSLISDFPEAEHMRKMKVLNDIINRCLVVNPSERISVFELKELIDATNNSKAFNKASFIENL